jgi:hypothetical protein
MKMISVNLCNSCEINFSRIAMIATKKISVNSCNSCEKVLTNNHNGHEKD